VSAAYWLLPVVLALLGGIAAYLLVKDRDHAKARRMLVVGLVLTIVYYALILLISMAAIFAYEAGQ
jgi:cytochrome bd-type quinol oxidase subunit 1